MATGLYTDLGTFTPNGSFNAVGYNSLDGYMYGYNTTTNRVVKLGGDMTSLDLPSIPNLPVQAYNIGDIQNGYLYLTVGASLTYFVVDINPSRSTYLNLVDPNTKLLTTSGTVITGATVSLSAIGAGDWAFSPTDGMLYYMRNADGIIRRMDPNTGVVTALTTSNAPGTGQYGSLFFGPSGELYGIDNLTGNVFKFVISGTNATGSTFSSLGPISGGDGARCAQAPIFFATLEDPPIKTSSSYVRLGDDIIYTIAVKNIGNVPATNVFLLDTLATETTFINNSLTLNNIPVAGSPIYPNGINLGTIPVGLSTVTFKVSATALPNLNPIDNTATFTYSFTDTSTGNTFTKSANTTFTQTTILNVTLASSKFVDFSYASLNDILTYTITLTNLGNTITNSLILIDTLPSSVSFVSNSLTQDGTVVSNINFPNITLPNNIKEGTTSTITFKVLVNSVPIPNPLINNSTTKFTFIVNPTIPTIFTDTVISNSVSTTIVDNSISLTKTVDKVFALCNDTLTYTLTLFNSGNITLKNLILYDTIPTNTVFITDSVFINNLQVPSISPENGIPLNNIAPLQTITVSFKTQIVCI
ncbi:MAG: DUF6923 family protein [Clostridium sp.]